MAKDSVTPISHIPLAVGEITTRRLDPETVADVLTFLRNQRPPEDEEDLVPEVRIAIDCGRAGIFDWLGDHLRGQGIIKAK